MTIFGESMPACMTSTLHVCTRSEPCVFVHAYLSVCTRCLCMHLCRCASILAGASDVMCAGVCCGLCVCGWTYRNNHKHVTAGVGSPAFVQIRTVNTVGWMDGWMDGWIGWMGAGISKRNFFHACMPACLHEHTYLHSYIHTYIPTYIHTYIHMHTHVHVYIYICKEGYTYIHIHS